MNLPLPPALLAALTTFLRSQVLDRLADLSDTTVTVVVGAAAPFAPTTYSRARLVRQMYASGLLRAEDVDVASRALAALGSGAADQDRDIALPASASPRLR
jgi:hypothetical protein